MAVSPNRRVIYAPFFFFSSEASATARWCAKTRGVFPPGPLTSPSEPWEDSAELEEDEGLVGVSSLLDIVAKYGKQAAVVVD